MLSVRCKGAGVWTWSRRNMVAMSEVEDEAVTGRGLKTGALPLRGRIVAKSKTGVVLRYYLFSSYFFFLFGYVS
jgi:hypothetical protein